MARDPKGGRNSRVARFKRGKVRPGRLHRWFTRFATLSSDRLGSPWAFAIAFVIVLAWAVAGPIFGFSDVWMLIINTVTTIGTFLMVFLIQNTQNRDAKAIHLKLDELIRAVPRAREEFMEAEEEDLEEIMREKQIVDRADPAPPEDAPAPDHGRKGARKAG